MGQSKNMYRLHQIQVSKSEERMCICVRRSFSSCLPKMSFLYFAGLGPIIGGIIGGIITVLIIYACFRLLLFINQGEYLLNLLTDRVDSRVFKKVLEFDSNLTISLLIYTLNALLH